MMDRETGTLTGTLDMNFKRVSKAQGETEVVVTLKRHQVFVRILIFELEVVCQTHVALEESLEHQAELYVHGEDMLFNQNL